MIVAEDVSSVLVFHNGTERSRHRELIVGVLEADRAAGLRRAYLCPWVRNARPPTAGRNRRELPECPDLLDVGGDSVNLAGQEVLAFQFRLRVLQPYQQLYRQRASLFSVADFLADTHANHIVNGRRVDRGGHSPRGRCERRWSTYRRFCSWSMDEPLR